MRVDPVTRPVRQLVLLLAVVLVASAFAAAVQTSFGAVDVRSLQLPTRDGQWVAADLFRPRSATAERPAPLVVVVPGFQRTKETLRNVSVELARRGVVVIAIDPYAQGDSSSSNQRRSATTEGYGLFAVVDYVHGTGNLNYVDRDRVAATGHSAGGNAAIRGASRYGRLANRRQRASKLHAVYVSGYVLTLTDEVLRHVRSNLGISYALYDEGAYRNEPGGDGTARWSRSDLRELPAARRAVAAAVGGTPDRVETGRWYGSGEERTLRILHNERLLHPLQPYSFEAMANQLSFFEKVFDTRFAFAADDQVWHWLELATLVSLLAAFAMLVPLVRVLLAAPWFSVLVHDVPPPAPRPVGRARLVFWGVFAASGLIACVSFVPLCEWSQQLFVDASSRRQTWFFPQRMNNAVMLWAVLNGVVGLLLFALVRFARRRGGGPVEPAGAGTSARELFRAAVLAGLVFTAFFALLALVHWLFHVDYRFAFLGVRPFRPALLALLPMYVPAFFVFFLVNSLRVAGMRYAGMRSWRGLLLVGAANTFGLVLILVAQYGVFAITGTVLWTDSWLYVNLLFALVPIMFVLPMLHRVFFAITGRIYVGAMTTCLIFIMIMLSNTVCYLPL